MKMQFVCVIVLACIFLLTSCHEKNKSHSHIIIATAKAPEQKLYFVGKLLPIKTVGVASPIAGDMTSIDFNYGERVSKGQLLLVIHSTQLADNYRKTVSDFLHKKQTYQTDQINFTGTQALYHAGVMARDDYNNEKMQLENAALEYLQAKFDLEKVLTTANIDSKKIEALTLADTAAVNSLMQRRFKHIEITAPESGIALFPIKKTNSSSDDATGKLIQGVDVKAGQLLLQIGNLSGLSATFDVSEMDIDRIHVNMPVTVTGNAFPDIQLIGYVTAVSAQANQDSNNTGVSMFVVKMEIPNTNKNVMNKIRVGMTAKFEMNIHGSPHIMLPINAVTEKNGQSTVTILDSHGKKKVVNVITGETTPTQVAIVSGVSAGNKVVVNYSKSTGLTPKI